MNKTKSILIYQIDTLSGEEPEPRKYSYSVFDSRENLTEEIHYNSDEEPEHTAKYNYDGNGFLVEEKLFSEGDEVIEWKTYERDADGKLLKEYQHYLDGSQDTTIFIYDDKNRLVEQKKTDADGFLESVDVHEYEDNLQLSETVMDGEGNLIEKISYSYNAEGILEESEIITVEDGVNLKRLNFFDENGNRIKSLRYNSQSQLIEISRYEFDDAGLLHVMEEENEIRKSRIEIIYDEQNNPVQQIETSDNGDLLSKVERVYNENGNMLESKVYIDGLGIRLDQDYILKYEYEYFND